MGLKKLEYDLGYTHIVQAIKSSMKRIGAFNPIEIDLEEYKNLKDIYYTPNTFNSPINRKREYLWQLNSFYIDIDKKTGYEEIDQFEVIAAIEELADNKKIPQPTQYVNSGRGIHIYWDINNCHIMLLDLWEKIEDYLYNELKKLEKKFKNIQVDKRATDPTRLLRLPGTINSKNNSECYSMLKREENIYNIFDLKSLYIKPRSLKRKKKSNIEYLPTKNLYTLNKSRLEDFKAIVKIRNGNVEGYRNTLIMLYSYHYRLINEVSLEELIQEVKTFNRTFKTPYKVKDIRSVCRSINKTVKHYQEDEKRGYKFNNKYIINSLDLSKEEQSKLLTIISKEEKYKRKNYKRNIERRNEEGLTPKQVELKQFKEEVLRLKEKDLSNRAIAKELNCSEGKIRNILKKSL